MACIVYTVVIPIGLHYPLNIHYMRQPIQAFIKREGSFTVLANLASHFEHYPVPDDSAREFLLYEAKRLVAAISSEGAVIN